MAIIANKNQNKTSISKIPSFVFMDDFIKFSGEDNDGNFEFNLYGYINIPSVVAGSITQFSIALTNENKKNVDISENIVWKKTVDISSFVDNTLLKKSSILSNNAKNENDSIIVLKSLDAKKINKTNKSKKDGFVFIADKNNFSKFNLVNNQLGINSILLNNMPSFSNIVFPKEISIRNLKTDGLVLQNKNNPIYNFNNFVAPFQSNLSQSNNELEKSYDTIFQERNYLIKCFKKNIKIPKHLIQNNDLKLSIFVGELETKDNFSILKNINLGTSFSSLGIDKEIQKPSAFLSKNVIQITNQNNFVVNTNIFLYQYSKEKKIILLKNQINTTIESKKDEFVKLNKEDLDNCVFAILNFNYNNYLSESSFIKINKIFENDFLIKSKTVNKLSKENFSSIVARNSENKKVNLKVILSDNLSFQDIVIKKRIRSFGGNITKEYSKINNLKFENGEFIDTDLKHDNYYEYAVFLLDNNRKISSSSFVFYRDPSLYFNDVAFLNVDFLDEQDNQNFYRKFKTNVSFSSLKLEDTINALKQSIDGNIQTSNGNIQIGNFIDNIKNNREKLADLFRLSIIRQDLDSGLEWDLGTFSVGSEVVLTNDLIKNKNIPQDDSNSIYVFRLLQRNAITLFNDIDEIIIDSDTLKEFKVKVSKFLNPLNRVSSIIPSDSRLQIKNSLKSSKFFINDEFIEGFTGVVTSLSINKSINNSNNNNFNIEYVKDPFDFENFLKINCSLNNDTLGYLITSSINGFEFPLGFWPNNNDNIIIQDKLTSKFSCPRKYKVYFVDKYLNYNSGYESQEFYSKGNL
jgi:hypothetical protein